MRQPVRRYSLLAMLRAARRGHADWAPAWPRPTLQPAYDVVIVGGGAIALALAAALARHYGRRTAVLADGPLTGGPSGAAAVVHGVGRTAAAMALLERSRRLFPTLSGALNFNLRPARRGLLDLAFTAEAMAELDRIADDARALGVAAWIVPPREVRVLAPLLGPDATLPGPLLGALWQPDAGIVDGDAVVWGYARNAATQGVDIAENVAISALTTEGGAVTGVRIGRHTIETGAVVLASGEASRLLTAAGIAAPLLPARRRTLVSESAPALLDVIARGRMIGGALRQSRRGELLLDIAPGPAPDPTDDWAVARAAARRLVALFPALSRFRLTGIEAADGLTAADGAPVLGPLGPAGLWAVLGWDADEVAVAPAAGLALAASIATGELHPLIAPFAADRLPVGAPPDAPHLEALS
jgi:sarcosine oxidase subunit beta